MPFTPLNFSRVPPVTGENERGRTRRDNSVLSERKQCPPAAFALTPFTPPPSPPVSQERRRAEERKREKKKKKLQKHQSSTEDLGLSFSTGLDLFIRLFLYFTLHHLLSVHTTYNVSSLHPWLLDRDLAVSPSHSPSSSFHLSSPPLSPSFLSFHPSLHPPMLQT